MAHLLLYHEPMRPYRIQQSEYAYHVTTRTNGQRFQLTRSTYRLVTQLLNEMTKRFRVMIHHVQLMSNHYHLVISTPEANLSAAMCFLNGRLALHINRHQGTRGHLWEKRFHATILENDDYAATCIRYVYHNPVRAGVCVQPEDAPFLSSFAFYAQGRRIPIQVTADGFYIAMGSGAEERQRNFCEFLHVAPGFQEFQRVGRAVRRLFYGSAAFLQRMRERYAFELRLTRPAMASL